MERKASIVLLCSLAMVPATQGQTGTWVAQHSDTGDGDGLIEPGESATVTFLIDMDPDVGTEIEPGLYLTNFGSGSARLSALENLDTGISSVVWTNDLMSFHPGFTPVILPDGSVEFTQPFANIFDVYDDSDPVALFTWEWTPADYAPRTVRSSMQAQGFGYNQEMAVELNYGAITRIWPLPDRNFSFQVVPAPGGVAALVLLSLGGLRRRRSGDP